MPCSRRSLSRCRTHTRQARDSGVSILSQCPVSVCWRPEPAGLWGLPAARQAALIRRELFLDSSYSGPVRRCICNCASSVAAIIRARHYPRQVNLCCFAGLPRHLDRINSGARSADGRLPGPEEPPAHICEHASRGATCLIRSPAPGLNREDRQGRCDFPEEWPVPTIPCTPITTRA